LYKLIIKYQEYYEIKNQNIIFNNIEICTFEIGTVFSNLKNDLLKSVQKLILLNYTPRFLEAGVSKTSGNSYRMRSVDKYPLKPEVNINIW